MIKTSAATTKRILRTKKGFTLVELLAVLIIVAILAAISAPIYMNYVKGARAADAQTTISAIMTAEKVYYQKYGKYTSDLQELEDKRQIKIDEATKNKWTFSIGASTDAITDIQATSTDEMEGGPGKVVIFSVSKGKFEGYGTDEDDQ